MFCRKCGKEIPDDSEFCPKCGTAIGKDVIEKISLQKKETVTAAQENVLVNYAAGEPPKSDPVNMDQTAAAEIKPQKSNKPLIITLTVTVIAVVLAAIFIPMAVSKNKDAHREFEYHLKADDTYMISKYLGTDLNVAIPDEIDGKPVSEISEKAFSGSSVESVTIGKNVWEIGNSAFSNCRNLRFVEILPNDDFVIDIIEENILINSIGDSAFANCSALETFIFPDSNFTEIGDGAFYQCSSLKSVELTGIMTVGVRAFSESGLQSVNLQTGETYPAVFADCKELKEVTLGNLVDISDEMFSGCTSLETVNWNFSPYMDNEIGSKAFYGCTSLKQFNTIDTPITYPHGFSEFIEGFRSLGSKDVVIAEDAFENCVKFKNPEIPKMTFTTILNSDGNYEDVWNYVFYDDPAIHGKWETVGYVWAEELDDWKKGNAQLRSGGTYITETDFLSDGTAILYLNENRVHNAVWSNGYVCHEGVRAPTVNAIYIENVGGVEYLIFEHKNASYNIRKLVDIYFVLERKSSYLPNAADHKKRIEDYMGVELADMSYKEFTDNFGMPGGGYFWGRAQYLNSDSSQVVAEVGFNSTGGWSGSGDGFDSSSRNKLNYIIIYGGTEMKIDEYMHLGEGLDYYNDRLIFDAYNALKRGAGDHGAVWYEVSIKYSDSSSGKPLYTVDLRLTEGDYICYAAKITSLQ